MRLAGLCPAPLREMSLGYRAPDSSVAEFEYGERARDREQGQDDDGKQEAARAHWRSPLLGSNCCGKAVEALGAPC